MDGSPLPPLLRWSSRNWSASASLTLTFESTSRPRRRVSSSWSRRSLRKACRLMPSAVTRWRSSGRVIWFWRATVCSAWSMAISSTLMPVSLASCNCARSEISLSSTMRASSGRGTRSASGFSWISRCTRVSTSVLVIGSELTSATMNSAERCTGAGGAAGRAAGGARRGPARMMSVMPPLERKPCWAPAVTASVARQARLRMERMCFMALLGLSSQS